MEQARAGIRGFAAGWDYQRTKHLAIIILIGAIVFTTVEGGLTAGQVRRRLKASADYDESLKALIDSGASAVNHVDLAAAHLEGVAGTLDAQLPTTLQDLHGISVSAQGEFKALQGATSQLRDTTKQIGDQGAGYIAHLDTVTTGPAGLIPQATADLKALEADLTGVVDLEKRVGLSLDDTDTLLKEVSKQTGLALDQVVVRLRDPQIDASLKSLSEGAASIATIAMNGAQASKEWPALFVAIRKASETGAKAAKFYWAARVISLLLGAFRLP